MALNDGYKSFVDLSIIFELLHLPKTSFVQNISSMTSTFELVLALWVGKIEKYQDSGRYDAITKVWFSSAFVFTVL